METSDNSGGLGGHSAPGTSIRTTRLIERALREQWDVPPERRPAVIAYLLDVVQAAHAGDREKIAAARALLSASKQNLEALKMAMEAEEFEELRARLEAVEAQAAHLKHGRHF
jgi:hypothetical protein